MPTIGSRQRFLAQYGGFSLALTVATTLASQNGALEPAVPGRSSPASGSRDEASYCCGQDHAIQAAMGVAEVETGGEAVAARWVGPGRSSSMIGFTGMEVLVHMAGQEKGWRVIVDACGLKQRSREPISNPASKGGRATTTSDRKDRVVQAAMGVAEVETAGEAVAARWVRMSGTGSMNGLGGVEVLVHMEGQARGWRVFVDTNGGKVRRKECVPNPASKRGRREVSCDPVIQAAMGVAEVETLGEAVSARRVAMNGTASFDGFGGVEVLVHMPKQEKGWRVFVEICGMKLRRKEPIPNPPSKVP